VTHLLQRGVPVAVPVLTDDGKACTTDDDGAPHAVFAMLPDESWLRTAHWIDDNFDAARWTSTGSAPVITAMAR
jgi:Ser/Thr protein kinase RdoA (MazF antagonist)